MAMTFLRIYKDHGLLMAMKNVLLAKIILKGSAAIIAGFALLAPFCVSEIKDYDIAVLREWGKLSEEPLKPGLNWYWPLKYKLYKIDAREKIFSINTRDKDGKLDLDAKTKDGWAVGLIPTITYKINKEKWKEFDMAFGAEDSTKLTDNIQQRIASEVRNALQTLVPKFNLEPLHSDRPKLINSVRVILGYDDLDPTHHRRLPDEITEPLPYRKLADIGIDIVEMDIQLELPQKFKDKLDKIAEQDGLKRYSEVRTEAIKAEELAEEENQKLQAIKTQIQIEQTALKKQTPAYVLFLEKWDGHLPEILTTSKETFDIVDELIADKSSNISAANKRKDK